LIITSLMKYVRVRVDYNFINKVGESEGACLEDGWLSQWHDKRVELPLLIHSRVGYILKYFGG